MSRYRLCRRVSEVATGEATVVPAGSRAPASSELVRRLVDEPVDAWAIRGQQVGGLKSIPLHSTPSCTYVPLSLPASVSRSPHMPLAPELHQGRLAIAEDHGLRQLHIDSPTAHQISAETDDARRWRRSWGGGPGVPNDGEKKTEQEWA